MLVDQDYVLELKQAHTLFYKPYIPLEMPATQSSAAPRHERMQDIDKSIDIQDWHGVRQKSAELIKLSLDGLRYLQTYVQTKCCP